jgi:hypothetical protein
MFARFLLFHIVSASSATSVQYHQPFLGSGASLPVTDATYEFVKTICIKLWNREVFNIISNAFEGDLSSSNVLSRLQLLTEMEQNCENELEFCSSHFWELQTICDSSELDKLDITLIHQLISRPSLQLMSEDSLWRFITQDCFREHLLFPLLLECVKFEYLSSELMTEFVNIVDSRIEVLTPNIWTAIRRRLFFSVLPPLSDDRFVSSHHPYDEFRPFSGIIAFLTRKYGGNVVDRQIVEMRASSGPGNASFPVKNVVDLDTSAHFWTENRSNQWICWDFKTYRIRPTHYSINSEYGDANLRTWVLEGSSDGSSWATLDERHDDMTLQRRLLAATFQVAKPVEVRLLRIVQKGQNHNGNDHLAFTALEFFGDLKESNS